MNREHGFVRAQVLVTSPPGLRGVHVRSAYEVLTWPRFGRNATASAWLFIVTERGAKSLDWYTVWAAKKTKRSFPEWEWTGSGFRGKPEDSPCFGESDDFGDVGPMVAFVSKCQSRAAR